MSWLNLIIADLCQECNRQSPKPYTESAQRGDGTRPEMTRRCWIAMPKEYIAEELLQAVRDVKAGKISRKITVEATPVAEARQGRFDPGRLSLQECPVDVHWTAFSLARCR